ncbi:DUF1993 domain-containing protein [Chondromyces crocatus]|uniref:DUF1993 domain-containing protein n=1 Tax=Chondromyces crocatus TaxID=52 RepID=A0A0K1ET58_CHOCO|nr:DUF1993 domain-containing protein [Chondromyces crocatus]AKT43813.1 uncharacterized protein CMC5_080500 [Chondromyces crocatus]
MNVYECSVPQMITLNRQARVWLDKAQAYAEQKKFDPEVLLSSRLAPDQWPLRKQIQSIALSPAWFFSMVLGTPAPSTDLADENLEQLRARLDGAFEELKAVKPEQLANIEERLCPMPFLPGKGMIGSQLVASFALPNLYFHATLAYAILRHNGVELGKMDFLGALDLRDV